MHTSFFQHSETLSFSTVLHVTEVQARDKDSETKVGSLSEELAQSEGAVGAGRPGAEPGDGVAEPPLSIPPQTRAQGSQVAQKKQLCRYRRKEG